jgi:hypothetical protein
MFLVLFAVGNGSAMDDSFQACVRKHANNPQQLFHELHQLSGSMAASAFCKCFEEKKDAKAIEGELQSLKDQQKEVKEAAQYVAESLYEKAAKASWDDRDNLRDLDYAQRFSIDVTGDGSKLQGETEQNDIDFVRIMTSDMLNNRKNFLEAFNGIEFVK